ncbi:MAG TPA: twin-arginine translocase subunit TatC [Phycisphaerales bacterium]|nr:twin-arginine translocase subunit TatC [Phycisphaerales bacterium]
MSFGEHLDELRRRLIYALLALVPVFLIAFGYGKPALTLMLEPLLDALREAGLSPQLQATGPLETFGAVFRVALVVTVIVVGPWALLQLWMFVAPGLYAHERRFAYLLVPLSLGLAVVGMLFLFRVLLPLMLLFLVNFGSDLPQPDVRVAPVPAGVTLPLLPVLEADPPNPPAGSAWVNSALRELRISQGPGPDGGTLILQAPLVGGSLIAQQYRVSEYIGLLLTLALSFAVAFQMPVVVLLLGWSGILDPPMLRRHRKHAALACGVLGAILTPTADPISMLVLAGPLYLLYELGLVLLRVLPAARVARGGAGRWGVPPDDTEGP